MQKLDFHTLSRSVQERFAASARGRLDPKPLACAPLKLREPLVWWAVIVASIVALVAVAAHGFGDARSTAALEGPVSLVVDVLLVSAIVLGVVRLSILRAAREALPYPRGVYVFPVSLVDARTSQVRVYPLFDVTSVNGPDARNVTSLEIGADRYDIPFRDRGAAEEATRNIREAMENVRSTRDHSDPRITLMFTLDPLQRPRVSSPVGPKDSLARKLPGWARHAWIAAPLVGLIVGPAVLAARNATSDRRMFARAQQADTVEAYKDYVTRGGRRSDEVRNVLLPRAELHEAERAGTVEAIEAFRAAHPNSAIEQEVDDARRAALLADLDRAKAVGTLGALQEFAKRHPDHHLEPELRASIHALFAPALDVFRTHAPADPQARQIVERLFAYSENKAQSGSTDTTVQIRFRRRPSKTMWKADKMVSEHHWFIGEASYPSRYFDVTHAERHEAALAKLLGDTFGAAFGPTVFTFKEGPRLDDAQEDYPAVTVPTLFITHVEDWPKTFDGSITKPRGIWIDVTFGFEAVWLIPGDKPTQPFTFELKEKLPQDVIKANPEGGTPQAPLEEKIYGAMADDAFQQFEARYVTLFVPAKPGAVALGGGPPSK